MKWPGMSGVGGQKPLIKGPLVGCILLLLLLLPQHHHCAHHPPLTVSAVKLRPERAALTPPTVTSLRPSDKGGNGKHMVGLRVRGEQSSSNSPPVVASRSPSSTSYSAYPQHNTQQGGYHHRPTAPIATAASGSRPNAGLSEHPSLTDHRQTAQSMPTLHGSRVSTGVSTPSSSDIYTYPRADATVPRRYPQPARISSERANPEPIEKSETSNAHPPEAGGWAEMDTEAKGGVWEEAGTHVMRTWERDHHPFSSQGRHDTFGHNITEDFTHHENEYEPRSSHGRGDHQTFSQSPRIDYSAQNSQTHIYPQEEGVGSNSNRHNHYQQPYEYTETSRNTFGSKPYEGYKPRDSSQQRHDQMRNNTPFTKTIPNRPLSLMEIAKSINLTKPDDLLPYLKRKGINFSQFLQFINKRPTKQAILDFLDRPDLSTTTLSTTKHEPQTSTKSFNESSTNFSLSDDDYEVNVLRNSHVSTKSSETSTIPLVPKSQSDTSFNEGIMHDSTESDASYDQSAILSKSPKGGLKGDELTEESVSTTDEQKQRRNRKKNRKDRGKKRKNKGKKKKRQRDRKEKSKTDPDLVYTTVLLPINSDLNDTGTLGTELPYIPKSPTVLPTSTVSIQSKEPPVLTAESGISNSSTDIFTSHPNTFPNQTSVVTLPSVTTRKSSFAQSTAPSSLPNSTQISFSLQPPDTSSSPATTLRATLIPTTLPNMSTTMEKTQLTSRTTKPSMPEGPQTDILTLSPPNKNSGASIISVNVMKGPTNETRKGSGDETIPEYSTPMRKRPKHHKPHQDKHGLHNGRLKPPKVMYGPPEHTSVPTLKTENEIGRRTNFVPEQHKDDYIFPIKGILIISGVMGALAVFTLVVLISYAVIKCSKKPVVNNYQVSEQKPTP